MFSFVEVKNLFPLNSIFFFLFFAQIFRLFCSFDRLAFIIYRIQLSIALIDVFAEKNQTK